MTTPHEPTPQESAPDICRHGIQRYHLLDVWMALGGDPLVFEEWMSEPRRSRADAWAQLMSAVRGDRRVLLDTNPPGDQLLALVWERA